jgi:protein-S-isoprenylcysteine O-methyltransferase Ste14
MVYSAVAEAITFIAFAMLVGMYVKLVRREKEEVPVEFGDKYRHYMTSTSAFFPRFGAGARTKEV